MGWWESENGKGFIGDRPADILGTALTDALGDKFDIDLFAGFLAALGSALLRNPRELTSETRDLREIAFMAEFADRPPVVMPVRPAPVETRLENSLFDALEAVAFQYQVGEMARPPTLAELLETLAFVARGHLIDNETRHPVSLRAIRPVDKPHA